MFGVPLQHQGSNAQEGYMPTITGEPLGLRLNSRHHQWSDSPLLDDHFAHTPMVADQLGNDKHRTGNVSSFQFSPFSRAESNRAVFDALPKMDASQLNRLGSGQYRSGKNPYGLGLSPAGSVPGQLRSGLTHQGSGLQHLQEPMLTKDDSASGDSVVMHGAHSLLEEQLQGMPIYSQ